MYIYYHDQTVLIQNDEIFIHKSNVDHNEQSSLSPAPIAQWQSGTGGRVSKSRPRHTKGVKMVLGAE